MPRTGELIHTWHEGEIAVQQQAGVVEQAARLTRGIRAVIPEAAQRFLVDQRFAILSWADVAGRIWASLRTGPSGFLVPRDEQTLVIAGESPDAERMAAALEEDPKLGVLVIEFATRRRMRVNGEASVLPNRDIVLRTSEVYSNCPQYIQARTVEGETGTEFPAPVIERDGTLIDRQRELIERADTLFIASLHPEHGADASHRGGNPGFVKVANDGTLRIPDYSGNNMFNTLGNIQSNPKAGLLFVDFESGRTLQLSGTARVVWDRKRFEDMPGAIRMVEFRTDKIRDSALGMRLRYKFRSYSPVNPK